jgi:D-tagatose-1,6-bisphosphate aldolase subunit GatZ/KbaZ
MSTEHWLKKLIKEHKTGKAVGIFSICSSHPYVLTAAMEHAKANQTHVLIEATSNQVHQFGGYTGMKPEDFRQFVMGLAEQAGLNPEMVILGGDHLGPNPWSREPAEEAMKKACDMVREYVLAGFTKIHLDASMYLGGDPGDRTQRLDDRIVAKRSAQLCQVAEIAYKEYVANHPGALPPVYVIGSEVPVPGGTQSEDEQLQVTEVDNFLKTVAVTEEVFKQHGLEEAFGRVLAVVVQPGVEFGDHTIHEYNREAAKEICEAIKRHPSLVFEGHSTDYQRPIHLRQLVEDGVAILKVGPALTFAMREAIFALSYIEEELAVMLGFESSRIRTVLDEMMMENPRNWQPYYHGTEKEQAFARKYSLSDRSRYYWNQTQLQKSLESLVNNLKAVKEIPITLLSQFMPNQYRAVREGQLSTDPEELIKDHIKEVISQYQQAIGN